MKNTLDTLQDVLLVFTVILLVYVLYRRLLLILGKEKRSVVYPTIGEKISWKNERVATIDVTLPEKTNLSLNVYNMSNEHVLSVLNQEFEIGQHALEIDCSPLTAGKYYIKLQAPKLESSLYFNIA